MAVQALAEGFSILVMTRIVASRLFNRMPAHASTKVFLDLRQ
jgi:hypothetical protein